jgi:hypothetical protein
MQVLWMLFPVSPAGLGSLRASPTSPERYPNDHDEDEEQNEIDYDLLFHAAYPSTSPAAQQAFQPSKLRYDAAFASCDNRCSLGLESRAPQIYGL